jgi:cysteinyl-tRNA synthetase
MSLDLLDKRIDLHVGGIDLRFPHHENERAQSNSVVGHEAVKMWVHGEHLLFEGRKMSKSAGNVVLVKDLEERGLDPLSLRLSLLENRYRSQMDLTWAGLEAANLTLKRWRTNMAIWGEALTQLQDPEISIAIAKDLDTPRVLLRLRAIEKDASLANEVKRSIFLYADSLLGLNLDRPLEIRPLTSEQVELLQQRKQARELKNWAESDRLRDLLTNTGIAVNDGPEGQSWSWS